MSGKGKKAEPKQLKEFYVPFRLEVEGQLWIEAPDAETARAMADRNEWEDDSFFTRAEHVNWGSTGPAKEVR